MRKFGYNVLLFISIFFVIIILYEIISRRYIYFRADFGLKATPEYLILGHSHPETAFNDSLISNVINVAQSGESYFYTFQKAKEIFKQNPTIKTVFIEFTNNQVNKEMDSWIWDEKYIGNRYPIYSSFMNLEDSKLLIENNYSGFINAFSIASKNNFFRILKNDFEFIDEIGGYQYLEGNKTDSLLINYNERFINRNYLKVNSEISELNLKYLTKIIRLGHKYDIRIVLIRSPQHERYTGYYNESIYQEILKNNYKNVEYLDLSKFSVRNEEFGDLEHLNYKGARKFSLWFDSLLKSRFLESPIDQQKIDKEIEKFNRENKLLK